MGFQVLTLRVPDYSVRLFTPSFSVIVIPSRAGAATAQARDCSGVDDGRDGAGRRGVRALQRRSGPQCGGGDVHVDGDERNRSCGGI